jgi:pimeloyl-ACP methyl ester carboxylesterase
MLHGTPGSRLKFSVAHDPARRLGLRIIAPDRWGYGLTSVHPEPSLPAFAADITWLADRLEVATFAVAGVSGGGPYAAATAALLDNRVTALALISPVGPIAEPGADLPLTLFHRFCFTTLARSPRAVHTIFAAFGWAMARSPAIACRVVTLRAPPVDRRIMRRPDVGSRLLAAFAEGLRDGADGPAIDLAVFARSWNVDPGSIRARTRIWIGTADTNVPIPAAQALARRIPDCELTELSGEGHLWVSLHYEDVLGWIAAASVRNSKEIGTC